MFLFGYFYIGNTMIVENFHFYIFIITLLQIIVKYRDIIGLKIAVYLIFTKLT